MRMLMATYVRMLMRTHAQSRTHKQAGCFSSAVLQATILAAWISHADQAYSQLQLVSRGVVPTLVPATPFVLSPQSRSPPPNTQPTHAHACVRPRLLPPTRLIHAAPQQGSPGTS